MNLSDGGSADKCTRLLRGRLSAPNALSYHSQNQLEKALQWHTGSSNTELTLAGWLTVCRTIGDKIAVQLDTGDEHHYLQFDPDRNRVVLIDPHTYTRVPVEETDVPSIFTDASISLIPEEEMGIKRYDALTVVTHTDHGTKIVLGRHRDSFVQQQPGDKPAIVFDSKNTFSLPHPMTPPEIDSWLNSEQSETVKEIVRRNHERNWGT